MVPRPSLPVRKKRRPSAMAPMLAAGSITSAACTVYGPDLLPTAAQDLHREAGRDSTEAQVAAQDAPVESADDGTFVSDAAPETSPSVEAASVDGGADESP